jgi:hypothetical protein
LDDGYNEDNHVHAIGVAIDVLNNWSQETA